MRVQPDGAQPDLLFDLTTAFEERGRHPHGTTRVERGLVAALAEIAPPRVGFVRYDGPLGRFVAVSRARAHSIAATPARAEARRLPPAARPRALWPDLRRRVEVWVRDRARPGLRLRHARLAQWRRCPPDDPLAGATALLIPAELQRHDFRTLRDLRRQRGIRVAFVFYDLLDVLPDGDPRLADLDAVDVPGTDFMVREGALLLAISRFSADALTAHLGRRGVTGPPVRVIRLAGGLAPGRRLAAVPGLAPGGFVAMIGDVVARKNHALIISVWRQLRAAGVRDVPTLVVAGRVAPDQSALVRAVEADPALAPHVRFLPNVGDDGLAWLYTHCRFTVFASRHEGFGLPVAESLAFGKLCVASSAEAIPEASQGLALHLDPAAEPAWVATIAALLANPDRVAGHEAAIRARFRRVSWHDTANDVLAALAELPA